MFKKVLAISTSIFLLVVMMTNMVLPVYAVNSNGESKKTPIQSGVYCIQSMAVQDMFLGVQDESKEDNAKIQISKKNDSNGTLNQQFYLWQDRDGYYTIVPMHTIRWEKHNPDMSSAKCISVEGVNGGVGTEVRQRYLSFDDSCKWAIEDVGNGQYEFTLKSNNFKLNVAVGSNEEGTRLQLDNGNGQDCQKFQLNNNSFNYEVILRQKLNNIRVKRTAVFNKEEIKAENTFMYRHVKSVEISSLVGDIDSNAFDGWNISSVVCPLKWLKRFDLSKLEYIGILSNSSETDVVNITKEDFEKCSNLKHLNIYFRNFDDNSDLLEKLKIEDGALDNCKNLKSVNIYSQVPDDSNKYDKQLGYSKYIKKLELTNNNNNLAYYINTNGYTEIKVPDGIQGIRAKRFRNKTTLIKLELPESINEIEQGAFEGCHELKHVKSDSKWLNRLPKSQIETLVIPTWVKEVHEEDFDGCYNLKELIFENDDTTLCGESCDAFEHIESVKCSAKTALSMTKEAKKNLKKLEIKEGTTEIGANLRGFRNLEELELPKTLKFMDDDECAFIDCRQLKKVKADPKWVDILPQQKIKKLIVPDWVLEVHEKDLNSCYDLKELIFESDDTKLCGESCQAFEYEDFKRVPSITCSLKTALSMKKELKNNLKKLVIKEGVTDILDELNDFDSLETIELPKTLKSVDKNAFQQNEKLEEVCCCLELLKYLPKNQIKTIVLKDENIDINKVIKNGFEGYEKLEKIVLNDNGKLVYCPVIISNIKKSDEVELINNGAESIYNEVDKEEQKIDGITYEFLEENDSKRFKLIGNEEDPLTNVIISPNTVDRGVPFEIGNGIKSITLQGNEEIIFGAESKLDSINADKSTRYVADEIGLYTRNEDGSKGKIEYIFKNHGKFNGIPFVIDTNEDRTEIKNIKIYDCIKCHKDVKLPEFLTQFNIPIKIGYGIESLILENNDIVDLSEALDLKNVNAEKSERYIVDEVGVYERNEDGSKGKMEYMLKRYGKNNGLTFFIDTNFGSMNINDIHFYGCDYEHTNVRLPEYLTHVNIPIKIGRGIESIVLENDDIVDLSGAKDIKRVNANKSTRYVADEIGLYTRNEDGSKGTIEYIFKNHGKFNGISFVVDTNMEKTETKNIKIFDRENEHTNVRLPKYLTQFNLPIKIGCGIESIVLENNDIIDLSKAGDLKRVNITKSNKYMVENGVLYEKDDNGEKGNKVIVPNQIKIIDKKVQDIQIESIEEIDNDISSESQKNLDEFFSMLDKI